MPKADPFAQHRLLELAALDRSLASAKHRRETMPELAVISAGMLRLDDLRSSNVMATTEVDDLDRASRKLDNEIDQVRLRSERDTARMTSGAASSKELENLQHEIASLSRRQGVLEDEALELMERRETADATLESLRQQLAQVTAEVTAAQGRRDEAFAGIDTEIGKFTASRAELVSGLPVDLVAVYERIRASGKVAAAELRASTCEACRMQLDRAELEQIRSAPVDEIVRCPECGAILLRT